MAKELSVRKRPFEIVALAILLWLVRGTIQQSWTYLRDHPRPLHAGWAALSALLYLLALLPEGLFWHWALRSSSPG